MQLAYYDAPLQSAEFISRPDCRSCAGIFANPPPPPIINLYCQAWWWWWWGGNKVRRMSYSSAGQQLAGGGGGGLTHAQSHPPNSADCLAPATMATG